MKAIFLSIRSSGLKAGAKNVGGFGRPEGQAPGGRLFPLLTSFLLIPFSLHKTPMSRTRYFYNPPFPPARNLLQ